MFKKIHWKKMPAVLLVLACIFALTGCGGDGSGKRIVRIAHSQSETHPQHLGMLKFEEYVEGKLGDKYDIQIFPNELLGSTVKAIELTQTGAIDFAVAATANLTWRLLQTFMKSSVCHTCSSPRMLITLPWKILTIWRKSMSPRM